MALAGLVGLAGAFLVYERIVDGSPVSRREVDSMRSEISELRRENSRLLKQVARASDRIDMQGGGFPRALEASAPTRQPREVPARLAARISKLKD